MMEKSFQVSETSVWAEIFEASFHESTGFVKMFSIPIGSLDVVFIEWDSVVGSLRFSYCGVPINDLSHSFNVDGI